MDTILQARIAALEAEAAHARCERALVASSRLIQQVSSHNIWEDAEKGCANGVIARLRADIRALKRENIKLRAKLSESQASQLRILSTLYSATPSDARFRHVSHDDSRQSTLSVSRDTTLLGDTVEDSAEEVDLLLLVENDKLAIVPNFPCAATQNTPAESETDLLGLFEAQQGTKPCKEISPGSLNDARVDQVNVIEPSLRSHTPYVHYFTDFVQSKRVSAAASFTEVPEETPVTLSLDTPPHDTATKNSASNALLNSRWAESASAKSNEHLRNEQRFHRNRFCRREASCRPNDSVGISGYYCAPTCGPPLAEFFKYGIQFRPSEEEESNSIRTLMVTNLPFDISLETLLGRIRGGALFWASILDSRTITGTMSAMIVFLRASAATEYAKFCSNHSLVFSGQVAPVTKVLTPTWPISEALQKAISDRGLTRCVKIEGFPPWISLEVLKRTLRVTENLAHSSAKIEHMELDENASLSIRFSSMEAASQAYEDLTSIPLYQNLKMDFSADPCAAALEDPGVTGET